MRTGLRASLVLLAAAALVALAGCGGSAVDAGGGDAPDAAGDVGLPDGGDTARDTTSADAKPLPDGGDTTAGDAGPPDANPGDSGPTDAGPDGAADTTPDGDATGRCEDDIAPLLAEAKGWIEGAQPRYALPLYEEAIAACPESVEARFGAALAEMADAVEVTLSLWALIEQGTLASAFFDVVFLEEESQDEWLAEQLHWAFASIATQLRSALARLDGLTDADVAFRVERAPVYHATRPLLAFRGTFDRGDVQLMRLVAQNGLFLLDILATQDFRTEWLTLITEIDDRGFDGVTTVLELLGRTLGESPAFLTVHAEDGAAAYAEAGDMLRGMGDSWAAARDWLRDEERDAAGQVTTLRDTSAGDMVVVAAGVRFDDDGALVDHELRFVVTDEFGAALDRLAAAAAAPGELVAWDEGPNWLLGAWVVVALKLGLVDIAALADLPLPLDNLDFRTAAGLLRNLTPFPFAFDFGALFANDAVGLRSFLPRPREDGAGILIEWECPDELADDGLPDGSANLLCRTATADTAHFEGTDLETVPDGAPSIFPYLGFHDPTLNGLLHVDREALGLSETPGYTPADSTSLNAGLAAGLQPILDLIAN